MRLCLRAHTGMGPKICGFPFAYMYASVCASVRLFVRASVRPCMCVRTYVRAGGWACVRASVQAWARMCVCACVCTRVCVCMHLYMRASAHMQAHTRVHVCVYTPCGRTSCVRARRCGRLLRVGQVRSSAFAHMHTDAHTRARMHVCMHTQDRAIRAHLSAGGGRHWCFGEPEGCWPM